MSVAFVSGRRADPTQQTIQSLLDENTQLIQAIVDYQNKGKAYECTQYQQILHRNLVYLATLADSGQNAPSMNLPAPGSQAAASPKPAIPGGASPAGAGMVSQGMPTPSGTVLGDHMASSMAPATLAQTTNSDMAPNIPPQNTMGGHPGGYCSTGSAAGSPMGQVTASPPQLQHPPMSAQNPIGFHSSPAHQPRPASGLSGPMPAMSSQPQMQHRNPQLSQHMMQQGQQTPQQYLMQQRQMQFRQTSQQQMVAQQQQQQQQQQQTHLPPNPPGYNMSSPGMMSSGYSQQQQPQAQRYNPYRPPQQPQQGRSHIAFSQQQQPQGMTPQSMQQTVGQVMVQPPMGPATMGPSSMGQSPMPRPPQVQ